MDCPECGGNTYFAYAGQDEFGYKIRLLTCRECNWDEYDGYPDCQNDSPNLP